MEEKDKYSHFQPLIPHSLHQHYSNKNLNHFFTISNNNNNIILRIFLILLLALISLWANFEASKTFDITIVNDAGDTPAGRRFAVSYVSNDEASRILLYTSSKVQQFLYPKSNNNDSYHKKHIDGVTLRLRRRSHHDGATVVSVYAAAGNRLQKGGGRRFSYVIEISPRLLEDKGHDRMAIVGAILRGMARVWMWDERAPQGLVDGMAEYVAEVAGFSREMVAGGGDMPACGGGRIKTLSMWHVCCIIVRSTRRGSSNG